MVAGSTARACDDDDDEDDSPRTQALLAPAIDDDDCRGVEPCSVDEGGEGIRDGPTMETSDEEDERGAGAWATDWAGDVSTGGAAVGGAGSQAACLGYLGTDDVASSR